MKHLRPIKALGQSFLTYEPAARQLVAALDPLAGETVLEIGPGKGALTRLLLEFGCRVVAVEVDVRLAETLRPALGANPRLEVIHCDFMEYELSRLHDVKIIGNLPYNLSSQMVWRLLGNISAWTKAVLTTQREFARRILGEPGSREYGPLAVFCDVVASREKLFDLRPEYFKPSPDVVSTSFMLRRRDRPLLEIADQSGFRRVVKAGFVQRRKTLVNNLVAALGLAREEAVAVVERAQVAESARAESLTPAQFLRLSEAVRGTEVPGSSPKSGAR